MHYGHRRIGNEKCDRIWIGENLSYMGEGAFNIGNPVPIYCSALYVPEIDFLEGYIFHDAIFPDGSDVYCNEECARKFNLLAKDYAWHCTHVTMNFKSITA